MLRLVPGFVSVCGSACKAASDTPGAIPTLAERARGRHDRQRAVAIGRARIDNGKPVDMTGEYAFSDGLKAFTGFTGLASLFAERAEAHGRHRIRFAFRRDPARGETNRVEELN